MKCDHDGICKSALTAAYLLVHSLSRNWEQKMVDDFFLRLWISSKRFLASDSVSLSRSHSSMIQQDGLGVFFSTLVKSPESLAA